MAEKRRQPSIRIEIKQLLSSLLIIAALVILLSVSSLFSSSPFISKLTSIPNPSAHYQAGAQVQCPPGYLIRSTGGLMHGEAAWPNPCISETECRLITGGTGGGGVCSNRCVLNFMSDRDNCGGCNISCLGVCSQGRCISCTSSDQCPGIRVCDPSPPTGICRECRYNQDVDNGQCINLVCSGPNQIRENHQCKTCPAGKEPFLNTMVFPHVEECRDKCPSGIRLPTGVCRVLPSVCFDNQVYCPETDSCVDVNSDRNNCGRCGNRCSDIKICTNARCICPPGSIPAGERCLPPMCGDYQCNYGDVCTEGPGPICCRPNPDVQGCPICRFGTCDNRP